MYWSDDLLRTLLLMLLKQNQFGDEPRSWFLWCRLYIMIPQSLSQYWYLFLYWHCLYTHIQPVLYMWFIFAQPFFLHYGVLFRKCVKLNVGLRFDHLSKSVSIIKAQPNYFPHHLPVAFISYFPPHTVSPRGGYETPTPSPVSTPFIMKAFTLYNILKHLSGHCPFQCCQLQSDLRFIKSSQQLCLLSREERWYPTMPTFYIFNKYRVMILNS